MSLPSEKECRRIVDRALGAARVADASVSLVFERSSHTRFANNEISTAGASESIQVVISAIHDTRTGRVTSNEIDDAALERAVRRAEELAELLPADPEYMGPLPAQKYLQVQAWDDATERAGAAERLPGVRAAVEPARREDINSSGFAVNEGVVRCVANKAGNFGWFRSTEASFSTTARTADGTGSGWASTQSWRWSDVDATSIAARALHKARTSAQPKALEPGDYTVILEPAAVAGLLGSLGNSLSARAAEEGRSFFSKSGGGTRLGEKLFHESVSVRSDPMDARRPGSPWGGGGFGGGGGGGGGGADAALAAGRIHWVENGVVTNLWYDRYWAKKNDREPTPSPANIVLDGGSDTLEGLIASTERGLLVTNFWYIRSVNPQTLQLTGLTRDGLWLIENGKIHHPVMNFRFNESPAVLLSNIQGMSAAVRAGNLVVPAIKAANFTFSSLSDAV